MNDEFLRDLRKANKMRDNEIEGSEKLGLSFRSNEFGGEAGEVQNKVKKLDRILLGLGRLNRERYPLDIIEKLREEMADAIITLDRICIQIEKEFGEKIFLDTEIKMKFNKFSEQNNLKTKL